MLGWGREWGLRSGLNEYDLAVVPRHVLHVFWASHLNVAAQWNVPKQAHDLCPSMRELLVGQEIHIDCFFFFGSSFFLILLILSWRYPPHPRPACPCPYTQLTVGFLRLFTHARDSISMSKFLCREFDTHSTVRRLTSSRWIVQRPPELWSVWSRRKSRLSLASRLAN